MPFVRTGAVNIRLMCLRIRAMPWSGEEQNTLERWCLQIRAMPLSGEDQ